MIKNIIFDFGNVIIKFNFKKIIKNFTNNEEEQQFIFDNVVNSPEWCVYGLIDSGVISYEQAVMTINDRTNNKHEELVKNFLLNYRNYIEYNDDIFNVITDLKNKGYKLYILSNINNYIFDLFRNDLVSLFDGMILSYEEHKIKPYDAIYKCLLNKYDLNPEESLFIDDRIDNIKTANKFGIKGRNVNKDDINDIKLVLKEYGVI